MTLPSLYCSDEQVCHPGTNTGHSHHLTIRSDDLQHAVLSPASAVPCWWLTQEAGFLRLTCWGQSASRPRPCPTVVSVALTWQTSVDWRQIKQFGIPNKPSTLRYQVSARRRLLISLLNLKKSWHRISCLTDFVRRTAVTSSVPSR